MKEYIMRILQIGSVWMFVCIAYFFATMLFAEIICEYEKDKAVTAHAFGCLLFGLMFCLWLYGG